MGEVDTRSTDLCRSCGLCCNGILFDFVPVEDHESARLQQLGLAIRPAQDGALRFDHPCPKFCGDCSIYAERPESCKKFRCELLKKMDAGQVSFTAARQLVEQAKVMIAAIRPLFGNRPSRLLPMDWTRIFDSWQSNRDGHSDSRLVLELTRLQRFLDLHFRSNDQRKMLHKKASANGLDAGSSSNAG
jgi:uncharacterized protein